VNWVTWWHNTLSIHAFFARYFLGAHFARPLVVAPHVARALAWLAGAALVLTALAVTRAVRRSGSRSVEGCVFAMWSVLVVVLNPLSWAHYALLLVLPVALVWRAVADPALPLPPTTRRRARRQIAAAVVGLTVPKEALLLLSWPIPTAPSRAPILSLHLWAALLVFATAASVARASRRTAEEVEPAAAPAPGEAGAA